MSKSNRIVNRIVLAVLGVLAVLLGAAAITAVTPGVRDAVTLPSTPTLGDDVLWVIVIGAAVLIALSIGWILTRGRGGTAIALREHGDQDDVTVNVALVRDLVEHELRQVRDVVGVRVDMSSVRRERVARIRVHCRRGGDAVAVLHAVDDALTHLDTALGRELPAVVHLTGGARSSATRSTRVL